MIWSKGYTEMQVLKLGAQTDNALALLGKTEVAADWRWRDRSGEFHRPAHMETRHLYFTVRMIWNHTMPEQYRFKGYKRYKFRSFYTEAYMVEAVYALSKELFQRDDLTDEMKAGLEYMEWCYAHNQSSKVLGYVGKD